MRCWWKAQIMVKLIGVNKGRHVTLKYFNILKKVNRKHIIFVQLFARWSWLFIFNSIHRYGLHQPQGCTYKGAKNRGHWPLHLHQGAACLFFFVEGELGELLSLFRALPLHYSSVFLLFLFASLNSMFLRPFHILRVWCILQWLSTNTNSNLKKMKIFSIC